VNPILAAAVDVQGFCLQRGWRFCFIGALAVQRWGEPRLTLDVDLTVLAGYGGEEVFADALLARFRGRLPDAREFALRHRVVLLRIGDVPVDVSLGALPFEARAVERASAFDIGEGKTLLTCGAEDLVVLKAFAGREKDWLDIEGVAVRQAGRLDEALIWSELDPLLQLKDSPDTPARLLAALARGRRDT
jgi:hypothetical protein